MEFTQQRKRASWRCWAWWMCVAAGLVCLALNVACLPFYAGSSVGGFVRWRLEHGRLTVKQSQVDSHEAFYVANNTEGLRWAPAGRFFDRKEWTVTVPLWMGWGPALATIVVTVVRRKLGGAAEPNVQGGAGGTPS